MVRTAQKTFTLTHRAADEIDRQPVQIEYVEELIDRFILSGRTIADLMYVERGPKHTLRAKTFKMREAMVEFIAGLGKGKASYFLDSLVHERLASEGKLPASLAKRRTLKEIRTTSCLGQREFAEKIGVSLITVSKIECGTQPLSQKLAIKISEAFGISIDEIDHSRKSGVSGDILRLLRLANGLSQYELADQAHLDQVQISAMETGRLIISEKTARRIAAALDCNPDFFFSEDVPVIEKLILYFENRGIMKSNPYFEQAMAMVQAQAGVKQMTPMEMIAMVREIADGLAGLSVAQPVEEAPVAEPACDPKKAIRENSIICLECGASAKTLGKKHLATHGLTPEEYRAKYGYKKGKGLVCKSLSRLRKEKIESIKIWKKGE